jgi:hypothetical protein
MSSIGPRFALLLAIDGCDGRLVTQLALRFAALVFVHPGVNYVTQRGVTSAFYRANGVFRRTKHAVREQCLAHAPEHPFERTEQLTLSLTPGAFSRGRDSAILRP